MSTKMHNYRIAKDQWWPFAKACRQFYITEHPIAQALNRTRSFEADGYKAYKAMTKTVDAIISTEWTVELQVFDEGETYLLRPLEHGYFFMNHVDQWEPFGVERVTYDSRTDVPPEDEKNEAVADWVDDKILSGEFFVFNVLARDDFMSICIDQLRKKD